MYLPLNYYTEKHKSFTFLMSQNGREIHDTPVPDEWPSISKSQKKLHIRFHIQTPLKPSTDG